MSTEVTFASLLRPHTILEIKAAPPSVLFQWVLEVHFDDGTHGYINATNQELLNCLELATDESFKFPPVKVAVLRDRLYTRRDLFVNSVEIPPETDDETNGSGHMLRCFYDLPADRWRYSYAGLELTAETGLDLEDALLEMVQNNWGTSRGKQALKAFVKIRGVR